MIRNEQGVHEELLGTEIAQNGWFAFFWDPEDQECPYWAEPVVGWGRYMCQYPEEESGLDGIEIRAMKVEGDVGVLDSSFLDAPNFIGVFYSRGLFEAQTHDIIFYDAILMSDPVLVKRIDAIIQERLDQQTIGTPDYTQTEEEQEDTLN